MAPVPGPRAKIAPLAPERFGVQFTIDKATHERLRNVQSLLAPSVAPGDLAAVFARALACLEQTLEKQKFGKGSRPGKRRGSKDPHYVPDEIKRAVRERDGGRCTFVGTGGKRCDARDSLQFDHVVPVARGGKATVSNIRLCCRAHNQYEAERVLGGEFMGQKREAARARSNAAARQAASEDLVPRLRELGLSAEQAAEAAARCPSIPGVPFEERLALALRGFAPASVRANASAAAG
jgi:5-methylcytosine-specific restriction endonuclease McrA